MVTVLVSANWITGIFISCYSPGVEVVTYPIHAEQILVGSDDFDSTLSRVAPILRCWGNHLSLAAKVIKQLLTLRIRQRNLHLLDEGSDELVQSERFVCLLKSFQFPQTPASTESAYLNPKHIPHLLLKHGNINVVIKQSLTRL